MGYKYNLIKLRYFLDEISRDKNVLTSTNRTISSLKQRKETYFYILCFKFISLCYVQILSNFSFPTFSIVKNFQRRPEIYKFIFDLEQCKFKNQECKILRKYKNYLIDYVLQLIYKNDSQALIIWDYDDKKIIFTFVE